MTDSTETRYEGQAGKPFGAPATEAHPFKVYMIVPGEKPATNGLSFETADDAYAWGSNLMLRWFVPTGFEVRNDLTGEVVRTY